jgi:uncharacterized protein YprB with RNaseH-like and TPR domain
MEKDRNKRDIKKELQSLKEQAEKEFGVKDVNSSETGFIERAKKFISGEEKLKENYIEKNEYSYDKITKSLTRKLKAKGKPKRIYKTERENTSPDVKLEDAVFGRSEEYGRASFYHIVDYASVVDPDAENLHKRYREILSSSLEYSADDIGQINILQNLQIKDVCYLDIETTGLSNSPLFLVGLMYSREGKLVLDQFFARDYTEEVPLLEFTRDFLRNFSAIVTFNGKGFDIPFILNRMKVFGIDSSMPDYHVDLLPISRKIVGKRTSNHKLSTLEEDLLGRKRIEDVPGGKIPELYHDYVRTGDASDIAGIIKHNRIDLISLMRLIVFYLSDQFNLEERD